jgi:protocatechuate 3,4-dioxygenase beta subunit
MTISRRRFVSYAGAAASFLAAPASAIRAQTPRTPTPAMTEGPFYPETFTAEPVKNLARGPLMGNPVPLALEGHVTDRFGRPVAGARVEIWQCDSLGRYTHSRDGTPNDRDANFAGFGWLVTGADGRYAFSTIRPVPYSGRTPHIHVGVKAPKFRGLITQMFVDGVALNQRDFVYRGLSQAERSLVTVRIDPTGTGMRAMFDLVLV